MDGARMPRVIERARAALGVYRKKTCVTQTSHVTIDVMSRIKQYESDAARQAAYRARKGSAVQVFLDPELLAALDAYIARQQSDGDADATRSSVVAKVLRTQLLRKR